MLDLTPEWTFNLWTRVTPQRVEIHTYKTTSETQADVNALVRSWFADSTVERISIFVRVGRSHADLGSISREQFDAMGFGA